MRIAWIASELGLVMTANGLYSPLASYRYRMIVPATELSRRGHVVASIGVTPDPAGFERAMRRLEGFDVAVFGKTSNELGIQSRLVDAAREANIRTVIDVCDENFIEGERGRLRRSMMAAADAVTASSDILAVRIAETTGRRATVILDPCEGVRRTPRWRPRPRLRVLWFGYLLNLRGLDLSLDSLAASGIPMRLVVVTNDLAEVRAWCDTRRLALAPGIELEFREWSLDATARSLQECDVVLLPIERAQSFNLAKGPNRVVDSLWAGRFVVANPVPSYEEFREWAWIGDDVAAGLAWAIRQPSSAITGRITQAQAHIGGKFSAQSIADAWSVLLARVCAARPRQA